LRGVHEWPDGRSGGAKELLPEKPYSENPNRHGGVRTDGLGSRMASLEFPSGSHTKARLERHFAGCPRMAMRTAVAAGLRRWSVRRRKGALPRKNPTVRALIGMAVHTASSELPYVCRSGRRTYGQFRPHFAGCPRMATFAAPVAAQMASLEPFCGVFTNGHSHGCRGWTS